MASINTRNGKLYIDFRYLGVRCREVTTLTDNKANRQRIKSFAKKIEAEILTGDFRYEKYFPNSPKAKEFRLKEARAQSNQRHASLSFSSFSTIWLQEKQPEWRQTHYDYIQDIFRLYLLPRFGEYAVDEISKTDIMLFRAELTQLQKNGKSLSASRVNHIMTPFRSVLLEASERFGFECPWKNIKPLPIPKTTIKPFTLEEVGLFLDNVRVDFRPYYTVRFFTGLRTGEIDGLTWQKVDFNRGQLIIDQALRKDGQLGPTKTQSSVRHVDLSPLVLEALKTQHSASASRSEFVFCKRNGNPLDYKYVTRKIWYPMLSLLNLEKRRPYHTRHTTATLWLAAGESPEWIAKQLGHSNTAMLFNVYSRYVPNLTRQDGSAFNQILADWKDQ